MKQSEAKKLVTVLKTTFPRQELAQASFDAYWQAICDLDYPAANAAVAAVIQGSKFFPSIAELREMYAIIQLGAPEPLHAWAQAVGPAPRHELVQRARRLVGDDWTWRNEPEWSHRKPFLAAYGEVLTQAIRSIAQPALAAATRQLEPGRRPAELPPAEDDVELVSMPEEARRALSALIGRPL